MFCERSDNVSLNSLEVTICNAGFPQGVQDFCMVLQGPSNLASSTYFYTCFIYFIFFTSCVYVNDNLCNLFLHFLFLLNQSLAVIFYELLDVFL